MNVIEVFSIILLFLMFGYQSKRQCRQFKKEWCTEFFVIKDEETNLPMCVIFASDGKHGRFSQNLKSNIKKHFNEQHNSKTFFEQYDGKTSQQIFEILLHEYKSKNITKNPIETIDEILSKRVWWFPI